MPLVVADYVLGADRCRSATQFLGFACFEFSLKASGFAYNRRWGAQLDCEIKRVKNGRVLGHP